MRRSIMAMGYITKLTRNVVKGQSVDLMLNQAVINDALNPDICGFTHRGSGGVDFRPMFEV